MNFQDRLSYVLTVDTPTGGADIWLRNIAPAEPIKVIAARFFGLSVEEYTRWLAQGGAAQCSANIKRSDDSVVRRCRNKSKSGLSAKEWLELERSGWRCCFHDD